MTDFNCNKQLEPFIKQLEESLSSAEWRDFANPFKKSTEILKAVLRLSEIFPTLKTHDDALHKNAKYVFENNLRNISNILQFCARNLPEDLHTIRSKLEEFLPELNSVKDLETFDFKSDAESEGNIARHLLAITRMTTNIQELLTFFKAAFFFCKHASSSCFGTEEFIKVSLGLTEILTMLESKSVASNAHTGGNHLLVVLFNMLDRPLKIALRALWLLFTFPAIEDVKFEVILTLCRCAVQIFVCAVDILMDITQFFLKDIVTLKVVRHELLIKFQSICDYCSQMLEEEPSDDSINEELGSVNCAEVSETMPKPTVGVKDTHHTEAELSGETQATSGLKVTADRMDSHQKSRDVSKETQGTHGSDPGVVVKDVLCGSVENVTVLVENSCSESAEISKVTQRSKPIVDSNDAPRIGSEPTVVLEDVLCGSVEKVTVLAENTFCESAEISKVTQRLKPVVDSNDAHCSIVDVLKETSLAKPTVTVSDALCESAEISFDVKDTHFDSADTSKQMEVTSLPKPTALEDTLCKNAEISEETQEIFVSDQEVSSKSTFCEDAKNSEGTQEASTLKPKIDFDNTHRNSVVISEKTQETSSPKLTPIAKDLPEIAKISEVRQSSALKSIKISKSKYKKSTINVKNTKRISFSISKKPPKISVLQPTANVKDTHSKKVCIFNKTKKTLALKSAVKATHTSNTDGLKGTPKAAALKIVRDTYCNGVNVTKKTRVNSAVKVTADMKDKRLKKVGVSKKALNTSVPKSAVKATHRRSIDEPRETSRTSVVKSTQKMKDVHSSSVDILKKTQKGLVPKSAVKATCLNRVDNLKKKCRTSVPKSTSIGASDPTVSQNACDLNFNIIETPKVPKETIAQKAKEILKNLNNTIFSSSKETHKASFVDSALQECSNVDISTRTCDVKPKAAINPTHRDTSSPSSPFLDLCDIKFDSLTPEQRKTLEKLISNYKYHVNLLAFSVKMSESEVQVHCKMCGQYFTAEDTKEHLTAQSHLQNIVKKSADNLEARAAISISRASSMSHPVTLFLDIIDIELDSVAPSQRESLQGLIERINYHTNHFSFAVKTTESELSVICKICGVTPSPENVEEHIKDPIHLRNVFKNCKKYPETRAAVPEIREENWKFLKTTRTELYQCSLCSKTIGSDINSWIQHFNSSHHCMKLKEAKGLLSPAKKSIFKNLFGREMFAIGKRRMALIHARVTPYTKPPISTKPNANRSRSFVVSRWKKSDSLQENTAPNFSECVAPNPAQNISQNFTYNAVQDSLQNTASKFSQNFSQNLAHTSQSASLNQTQNLVQSLLIPEPINLEGGSFSQIFYSLSPSNQQIVRNIVAQIKNKINDFVLSVKPGSDELLLTCKACRCPMRSENVAIHVSDPRHLRMVAQSRGDSSAQELKHHAPGTLQNTSQNPAQNSRQNPIATLLPEPIHFDQSFYLVFDSLSPNNQQTVRNIVSRIKNKISNFGLSVQPGSNELHLTCKICCCPIRPENIEVHISDPRHLKMVAQNHAEQVRSAALKQ